MLIAGETSGDLLGADLVRALRAESARAEAVPTNDYQPLYTSFEPRFFGAGGPKMAEAGVELSFDMTKHSVIGLSDALRHYFQFRRLFKELFRLALERQPDVIICIDFAGFNRRFAGAIRRYINGRQDWFHDWKPRIVQYVSPQVWASRPGRAYDMAHVYDLLLVTFPFEKEWYAKRVPNFRVEFVGQPLADRYPAAPVSNEQKAKAPSLLLLPGSRRGEIKRHVPVLLSALQLVSAQIPVQARMILPNQHLIDLTREFGPPPDLQMQCGGLEEALTSATVAIAKTGTVTLECAWFGVPTVTLYKTSLFTYEIGKRIVKVNSLTMPNLLAKEHVFPEFIQDEASPGNIANAALELLRDEAKRVKIKARLREIIEALGGPGASARAARAIVSLMPS